ncbi:MAG: T9SS type A sorting domain-containing protein [Bacteroidota bacterium]
MKKNLRSVLFTVLVSLACISANANKIYMGCSDAGVASASSDSICDNGHTDLILSGYTGNIQWQSFDGTNWIDETGTGSTTDFYTVTLTVSTDFRAVVTVTSCPPDTSNTISIVVGVDAPVTTGDTRCGYGQVTLSATGSGTIKWYDAPTGGNLLYTGSPYITNVASTTTFYATNSSNGGGTQTTPMPPEATTFSSNVRGYWFTAPSDFTITGLFVPTPANGATQNIAVVSFVPAVPPPVYATVTNAFTTLFLTQNDPATGVIPVNIPVAAGDVIGILGSRSTNDVNSYAPSPATTTIAGQTVTITRMGMQFALATTAPQDLWQEAGGSISRVEITYEVGCESASTPALATVTTAAPVTISASPPALCAGQSSTLSANSTNPSYTFTWSPATGLSGTTGTPVTATPASPITYTVVATDGTCGAIDSVFIDVGPISVAGTATVSTDSICLGANTILHLSGSVGNIQWQGNSGSGWVNETGTGNDSIDYQVSPIVNTDYRAVVISGGCDADTSILLHVEVITITDPTTVNDTICGPGVVNLSASGAGLLSWFTSLTGGIPVNTGLTYSPNISTTTTYYVQASAGAVLNVGPSTNNIGIQGTLTGSDYGLQFDVTQQATIERVYVYPQQTGPVIVNLRDAQGGPVLNSVVANVTGGAGKTAINLGFTVNPFTGYRLELAAGGPTCGYNISGAAYPYTVTGSPLTITGSIDPNFGNGGLYYFFYDWEVSAGCKSNLIPVTGVVIVLTAPTITQLWNTLTSSPATTYQWYLNGNIIAGATGQSYNMTQPGSYTVVITDANGCSATSTPFIVAALGIEEFENSGILIYPNPASSKLYINFPSLFTEHSSLRITNTIGAIVYENKNIVNIPQTEIDLKNFAEGIYMLEIKTDANNYRKVFLKL